MEPKSVCAPSAAFSSEIPPGRGGFLMQRVSLPLVSSRRCLSARRPSLNPSRFARTSMSTRLTSAECSMNGRIVHAMRAFTVDGYVRWTGFGNASASSCEILMNSTVSRAPLSSVALAPGALYL